MCSLMSVVLAVPVVAVGLVVIPVGVVGVVGKLLPRIRARVCGLIPPTGLDVVVVLGLIG